MPPYVAAALVPGLAAPTEFRAIVNAHFRIAPPADMPPMLGVINGTTEWIFAFPGRLSVTISAADRLIDTPRDELAQTIWREVAAATGLPAELPPWQIVRERRATFAATPEQDAQAPRRRDRNGAILFSPAIGPRPACRRRSKARSAPATAPPSWCASPRHAVMNDDTLDPPRTIASSGDARRCSRASSRTATGCSSSRPTPPSRPNTCCCATISASRSTPSSKRKIAVYLRRIQGAHGGWPLFHDGDFDMSASVKAYFALR